MSNGVKERFLSNVVKTRSCWMWLGKPNSEGYGRMRINGIQGTTHRISYELFKGRIKNNFCVCHSCDNRLCVNPKHLWLGTHDDNMRDMWSKGRGFVPRNSKAVKMFGENNGMCKLNARVVRIIRKKYIPYKYSAGRIAIEHGVSRECIREIVNNRTWR